jgi:bifunctional non-homologous end joining protein LigD
VACGDDGISSFNLLRHRWRDQAVFLYAFDLIEVTGDDRRRDPLEQRKLDLSRVLAKAGPGLRGRSQDSLPNGCASTSGLRATSTTRATIFLHACRQHCKQAEGSRPTDLGRSPDWLKMKNPDMRAVKREVEEDWGSAVR